MSLICCPNFLLLRAFDKSRKNTEYPGNNLSPTRPPSVVPCPAGKGVRVQNEKSPKAREADRAESMVSQLRLVDFGYSCRAPDDTWPRWLSGARARVKWSRAACRLTARTVSVVCVEMAHGKAIHLLVCVVV